MVGSFSEKLRLANKRNDTDAIIQIIGGEVGKLVATDKDALIEGVIHSGFNIPKDISDDDLMKGLANQILNKNKKVINAISELIIKNEQGYSSDAVPVLGAVGEIVSGVGNIVGGAATMVAAKEGTKQAASSKQGKMLEMISAMQQYKAVASQSQSVQQAEAEKSKRIFLIVGGISLVVIIAIGGFIMYKKSSQPS